jgi:aminomethyltransferase
MVDFAGWWMPVMYPGGIITEHIATRTHAGLFDVSHMGRFVFRGAGALPFLRRALTNDAATLAVACAQYTIITDEDGAAIDDAFLYRFAEEEYLLVVNASNATADWDHLTKLAVSFGDDDLSISDETDRIAMLALQGPESRRILESLPLKGGLPPLRRNEAASVGFAGAVLRVARTGYTGEPVSFELFVDASEAPALSGALIKAGAAPVGLGARDTLRLEAGLPLFGHEFGPDIDGNVIPLSAVAVTRHAVDLDDPERHFVGRKGVEKDWTAPAETRRVIVPLAVSGRAAARAGAEIFAQSAGGERIGYVTSGSAVPCLDGGAADASPSLRICCLALFELPIAPGAEVFVGIRKKRVPARVVKRHMAVEGDRVRAIVEHFEE